MITILVLFHSNTFRNFKHFYLFHVCRELKEEFPHLLSYTRFVERMPRVAAYAVYDTKPSINMEFVMDGEAEVKQLTLF
ncbi:hypothetical protein [uncultured Alloprevotella sp.]|uniref:hypothetical protein n=1 Tax=uncultured Alloprevotella sp. TaxID=1283315 RepID=UPI0026244BB3|nr:hypothetical protein [uncultured Alloprevotella sp.]